MDMYGLMLDLVVSFAVVIVAVICGLAIIYDLDHPSSVREDRIYAERLMSRQRMEDMEVVARIRRQRLKELVED